MPTRREFIGSSAAWIAARGLAAPSESAGALTLWYRQPAAKWVEALPIGNGRLGAMVFGGVEAVARRTQRQASHMPVNFAGEQVLHA